MFPILKYDARAALIFFFAVVVITNAKKRKQLKTLEGITSFPLQEVVRGKNIPVACYRFQLQKYLLVHTLVQEQLPHLVDHILNHRLIQFRLKKEEENIVHSCTHFVTLLGRAVVAY